MAGAGHALAGDDAEGLSGSPNAFARCAGMTMFFETLLTAAAGLTLAMGSVAEPAKVDRSGKPQTGEASFYGERHAGRPTASGEPFDPGKLTAASPNLPLGTKAKVTNTETGKSVHVTVTDRGPYAKDRILDLSAKAAERLDMKSDGVADVKVQPVRLPKAEPAGQGQ